MDDAGQPFSSPSKTPGTSPRFGSYRAGTVGISSRLRWWWCSAASACSQGEGAFSRIAARSEQRGLRLHARRHLGVASRDSVRRPCLACWPARVPPVATAMSRYGALQLRGGAGQGRAGQDRAGPGEQEHWLLWLLLETRCGARLGDGELGSAAGRCARHLPWVPGT